MYSVHDWAEIHRLHYVEGMGKAAIAAKLGDEPYHRPRLLGLSEPPRYERCWAGSKLDPFYGAIAAMWGPAPQDRAPVLFRATSRAGEPGWV